MYFDAFLQGVAKFFVRQPHSMSTPFYKVDYNTFLRKLFIKQPPAFLFEGKR